MNVTNKLKMDMTKPDVSLSVDAVQGDAYSRSLCIALYTGLQPWMIPEDVTVAVRYGKSDRTKGYYDTLPDGTRAWSIQENLLTVWLAPQMLTVPGKVRAQIELIQGVHVLSTFCLTIHVEANPAAGVLRSENYINWLQWIQDQSVEQVTLVQQSAQIANQASQSAVLAAELAATAREETKSIAADVSAIVAGNEAYTKQESHSLFSPAVIPTVSGNLISVSDSYHAHFQSLKIFGKTTQDGTPTQESPVPLNNIGTNGNIGITIYGKNLLQYPYINTSKTENGVTFTDNGDGSITIRGTASTNTWFNLTRHDLGRGWWSSDYLLAPYVFSGVPNGISINYDPLQKLTFLTVLPGTYFDTTIYPQIEIGAAATVWEPPRKTQEITLQTSNGLPGIPVSSGGNYTDESGQQWICDEIDFECGVYVQRIASLDSYNGEAVNGPFLSTTGILSTGATVLYLMDAPVKTDLGTEVLDQYKALCTWYPNTSIYNNQSAQLEARYIADTKCYIDLQIQRLSK